MKQVNRLVSVTGDGIMFFNTEKQVHHTIPKSIIETRYLPYDELAMFSKSYIVKIACTIIEDYTLNYYGER